MMAKEQGLVRAIGVSNYKIADLEALQGDVPSVNREFAIGGPMPHLWRN